IIFRLILKIIAKKFIGAVQWVRPNHNNIEAKRLMVLALGTVDIPKSEQLTKKIVLVTGASSQIGLCVVRRLIASGAAVIAINRVDEIPYRHAHLRWIKGDLTDPKLHLDGYCVDAVVHCAPLWILPPLVEMLKNSEAKRIIAFSSTSVFFKLISANDFEKDSLLKLQNAEDLLAKKCVAEGINYTIFRPTQIYGVGLDTGITKLAKIIFRFRMTFVYPPAFGRRQPVHADDLSMAVVQAIGNEATYDKSYNLSGGEVLAYRDMLVRLFGLFNKKPRIISSTMLPFALDVAGKLLRKKEINGEIARRMNDDLVFFYDDAARDFNFHPRKFLTGGVRDIEGF
ncbi:MAG: NAD-dependent epimerase/dehydratase family protein, partial [Rickettsiales bacterium]